MAYELGPLDDAFFTGGVEVHIVELSKALVRMGQSVTFLTGNTPHTKKEVWIDGIRVIRTEKFGLMKRTWNPDVLTFTRQLLFPPLAVQKILGFQERFDIIHGHIYTAGLTAYLVGKLKHAVSINTIHGSYYDVWHLLRSKRKARVYKAAERIIATLVGKLVDAQIHTESSFAKKVVEWGVGKEKVHVIFNGVNLNRFFPNKPLTDAIPRDLPIIMTARRLVPKCGVKYLVESAPIVLKRHKVRFVIIGEGPEKQKLVKKAKDLGLKIGEDILFLGSLPHEKIPNYMAAADIVAVPSIVEATSVLVMEAMAMEKPVIATNINGIREITEHLTTSYLVEPRNPKALAEGIIILLEDKLLSKKIAKKAKEKARKEFSWENIAKKTLNLYQKTLALKN
ncbi:MAG: glycosyltransferase family 4 protein [Candidatus Wukongarchaeota archaeon]|nr:glycosyltransferase family 4 protein [Candidatus Wukongarchaeota archaeon]MDO8128446.1 glycosyltransferase family 4 protein [Candidatus Wukongarchaeota archaeon]